MRFHKLKSFFKKLSLIEPENRWLFLFAAFFSIGSALWLWQFLRDFCDPSGANGYFYLKQTECLASGLGFYFKDRSLAFLLPVLIMKLTRDSLLSFQISIAIVWAFLVFGVTRLA